MAKEREELIDMLEAVYSMSTTPEIKPLKDGYITDENMSVKWNREKVEESKRLYKEKLELLRNSKSAEMKKAEYEILAYIKDSLDKEYSFDKLKKLYAIAYSRGHSDGAYSILDEIDDLTDFLNEMNE